MEPKAGCGQEGLSDELGGDGGRKASSTQRNGAATLRLSNTVLHHPAGTYGESIMQVHGEPKGYRER